jgi:hypothetical protein
MTASTKRDSGVIRDWAKAISNHAYWCAATSDGNSELLLQKWKSILNHVANIHHGHGDKYPNCEHGPLEERLWIKKGNLWFLAIFVHIYTCRHRLIQFISSS